MRAITRGTATTLRAVLYTLTALAAVTLNAQTTASLATWVDACEATEPDLQDLLEAEVTLVAADQVIPNFDTTFRLPSEPFTASAYGGTLCRDSRFYAETHAKLQSYFRSAVLVAPDLILTSWHSAMPELLPLKAIFGLHSRLLPGGACAPADFDHIPADNVFRVVEVVADGDPVDFLLLRLDRQAEGHQVVRVRRSGLADIGSRATTVGHPERLAAKVDQVGWLTGYTDAGWPLFDGPHLLPGSSGSMVFNRDQRLVETTARGLLCANYDNPPNACWTMIHYCLPIPDTNAPLSLFAHNIPPFELLVEPLDDVVHMAALGGPLTNPTSTRVVRAPGSWGAPALAYLVTPPALAPPGEPQLAISSTAPPAGILPPGASFEILEQASASGVPCGEYTRTYSIADTTHGFVDPVRHVFEIGVREIDVEPSGGAGRVSDIAAPFENTFTYEILNPQPTPVLVKVTATKDFVTLNGVAATMPGVPPSIQLWLPPYDSEAPVATVVQGFGGFATDLPIGQANLAHIEFEIQADDDCPVHGNTTRPVFFTYGKENFEDPTDVPIPDGSPFGITRQLQVPETFCVGDVDVRLQTQGAEASQLRFMLVSPGGRRLSLWNHHGSGDLDVLLDDGSMPPPTGQLLSTFNGQPGGGTWQLRVFDDVPGIAGQLTKWGLSFTAGACAP